MTHVFIIFEEAEYQNITEIMAVTKTEAEAKAFVDRYNADDDNYDSYAYYEEWPIDTVDI